MGMVMVFEVGVGENMAAMTARCGDGYALAAGVEILY